jgi:prepilin-type processing-associated H-X9-DG protein
VGLVIGNAYARGSYVANNGIGPMKESTVLNLPLTRPGGIFYLNSQTRIRDIFDGTTRTALISETYPVPGEDWRGVLHYPEGPLYHHNYTPNSSTKDEIRAGACVSTQAAPCDALLFGSWNPRMLTMSARSPHAGGVNLALADGSIQFFTDAISLAVWQAFCTPQALSGEVYTGPLDSIN